MTLFITNKLITIDWIRRRNTLLHGNSGLKDLYSPVLPTDIPRQDIQISHLGSHTRGDSLRTWYSSSQSVWMHANLQSMGFQYIEWLLYPQACVVLCQCWLGHIC